MTKKAMFIIISSLLCAFIVTATVIIVLGNKEKENLTATTNTAEETTITTETAESSEVTTETVEVTTSTMPSPDEIQASIDELERTSESLAEVSASISESIEASESVEASISESIAESIAESEREAQATATTHTTQPATQTEPPTTTARSYNPHLSKSSITISVGNTDSFVSQAGRIEVLDAPCDASLDYSGVDFYTAGSYTAYFNAFDGSFSLPLMVNVN